jgi:hypothetical protein
MNQRGNERAGGDARPVFFAEQVELLHQRQGTLASLDCIAQEFGLFRCRQG